MENYEQKYKDALPYIKDLIEHNVISKESAGKYFPEIKESEDEKSKKWVLEYLYDGLRKSDEQFKGQFNAAIAWLEKQGEQKSAWSEEDERMFNSIIEDVMPYGECPDYPTDEEREYFYEGGRKVKWLKSLKERIKK